MSRRAVLKCDRCGVTVSVREREDTDVLPQGWRHLSWTSSYASFGDQGDLDLCEPCVKVVQDALMRPPQPSELQLKEKP